jgi:hypothetical protein
MSHKILKAKLKKERKEQQARFKLKKNKQKK